MDMCVKMESVWRLVNTLSRSADVLPRTMRTSCLTALGWLLFLVTYSPSSSSCTSSSTRWPRKLRRPRGFTTLSASHQNHLEGLIGPGFEHDLSSVSRRDVHVNVLPKERCPAFLFDWWKHQYYVQCHPAGETSPYMITWDRYPLISYLLSPPKFDWIPPSLSSLMQSVHSHHTLSVMHCSPPTCHRRWHNCERKDKEKYILKSIFS